MNNAACPEFLNEVANAAQHAAFELCEAAKLVPGQTVVVGCSTSEIAGRLIGTSSSIELGAAVFNALYRVFTGHGIYIAAQCCEHLNRALIIEQEAAGCREPINVVPVPEAGGAFAAAAYKSFSKAIALEEIQAAAGLDIGGTLIGMHLKRVAIPLRLKTAMIGKATVVAARTRPKLIGGARTHYDESMQ